MPFRGITETLSDVESVRAVHYPDGMFLKLDDGNGHQISANNFVTAGSEQHAKGAYDPGSENMGYHGTLALTRKGD